LGHPDAAFYLGRYYHAKFDVANALKWYEEANRFEPVIVDTEDGQQEIGNVEAYIAIQAFRRNWQ
jgi:hypothetical protein